MNKPLKILLGIGSIIPIIHMIGFFIVFIFMFLNMSNPNFIDAGDPEVGWFILLFTIHLIVTLISIGLLIYYIVLVFKTESIEQNMKILWTLLLFFFGIFVFPVFWYLYIWRTPATTTSSSG